MSEVLRIEAYSFKYAGSDRHALLNVNFEVNRGEIVVVTGPSGCGKSTLLRSINGLIPHMYPGSCTGSVIVDGENVSSNSMSYLATKVGYVFQNPENQIFMFSVERDVAFGLENLGISRVEMRSRVNWAMKVLGITHLMRRTPHELSDGQKQRVAIAGVIAMKPKILILDEPTSLLDPHTALDVISAVKRLRDELNVTVIIVEHRLDLVSTIAEKMIVFDRGQVISQGNPEDVLGNKAVLSAGIGVPSSTRIRNLLVKGGLNLDHRVLSMNHLAKRVNEILNDKS